MPDPVPLGRLKGTHPVKQSPETKILRDLVTAIKRGKKPDVTAAEAFLASNLLTDDYIDRKLQRATDAAYAARCRLGVRMQSTVKASRIFAAYRTLSASIDKARTDALDTFIARRNEILAAARSGKLTKKQFDQAIKELCK